MSTDHKEIHFLDSFQADTHIVRDIIDTLIQDLRHFPYTREEKDEIILAMDEAITNAVQETLFCHDSDSPQSRNPNEITVRYRIGDGGFDATIIDHGKGLDLKKMLPVLPDKTAHDYKNQLYKYAQKADGAKLRVRLNGREIALNGIGAGLKIILTFMDSLTIDLIDKDSIITSDVRESTEGSILNMQRKRRY